MENEPSSHPENQERFSPKAKGLLRLAFFSLVIFLGTIGIFNGILQDAHDQRPAHEKSPLEPGARVETPNTPLATEDGALTYLNDQLGKVTLLSFWATWCGPCRVELPTMGSLHSRLKKKGLSIVAVNVDEASTAKMDVIHFWKLMDLPFNSFFDPKGEVLRKFNVDILPANFLLDEKGNIAMVAHGANDWSHPMNIKMIEDLLAEKSKPSFETK